jgi:predicted dehydrogenase
VIGDGGEITCNPGGDVMVYNAETGRKGVAHPTENDNGHGKAIEDFANVVLHGARPKATAADSLGELRTALAIYKSAETKQWENVWADDLENVNLAVETVAAAAARL